VLANGNLTLDESRRLAEGEVVKVLAHSAPKPPQDDDVRLRYLDQHLVIVEKPAGMTSIRHREERNWTIRRRQQQPTLEECLPRLIAQKVGKSRRGLPPPVRAVHRLDRGTSGLMVFARTVTAERSLGAQFKKHTIHRRYLAVVQGVLKEPQRIESHLVRDRGDGRRGSTDDKAVGKRAVTHVAPLEALGEYTLVECRLETGRTHQIRIHLAELGMPLCGERVYHQPLGGTAKNDASDAPRIALHAAELGLAHPATGETLLVKMALPPDLAKWLEKLRARAKKG
jgi:23S rRNA pseudouridine1911/1915/1917 synthase